MRRIIFYLLLAAVLPCTQAYGQTAAAEVTMETIAFAEKDGRTLWLDKYETPGSEEARPVVLFAFGGGFYTGDRAQEYQDIYVHTLGNLTLTRYNPTLGNKSFAEKRDRKDAKGNSIGYKNGLKLNDDVRDKDAWSVDCIRARTKRMVEEIMTMFAL